MDTARRAERWALSQAVRPRQPSGMPRTVLSQREGAMLKALAGLIVPSDDDGPGADDPRILRTLAARIERPGPSIALYARGFESIDTQATRKWGCGFLDLDAGRQQELISVLSLHSGSKHRRSRIVWRSSRLYWSLRSPAAAFFPVLVDEVMNTFYTSSVAWRWLNFDGPPMPRGYLDVTRPRECD